MHGKETPMRRPLSLAAVLVVVMWVCVAGPRVLADASVSPESSPGAAQTENATPDDSIVPTTSTQDNGFLAALNGGDEKREEQKEEPLFITALNFTLRLALVLLLAYGTIYALKRFTGMKNGLGQHKQCIRVLETATLAANRSLHLVQVGAKNFLIASTPSQVNLVAELRPEDIPEPDAVDLSRASSSSERAGSFKEQLAGFLGQKTDSANYAKSVAESLRESSGYFQDKARDVGSLRRKLRDAQGN